MSGKGHIYKNIKGSISKTFKLLKVKFGRVYRMWMLAGNKPILVFLSIKINNNSKV